MLKLLWTYLKLFDNRPPAISLLIIKTQFSAMVTDTYIPIWLDIWPSYKKLCIQQRIIRWSFIFTGLTVIRQPINSTCRKQLYQDKDWNAAGVIWHSWGIRTLNICTVDIAVENVIVLKCFDPTSTVLFLNDNLLLQISLIVNLDYTIHSNQAKAND